MARIRKRKGTHFVDVVDDTIDYLSFERLEHDRAIPRDEFRLPTAAQYHALPNIEDGYDGDDVPKLPGTRPFDIGIEFRFEEGEHARTEVRRMQQDGVGQLFLEKRKIMRYSEWRTQSIDG